MRCQNVAGQLVVGGAPYGPDSFEQKLELFPPRDSCQIPLLPEPRYGPSLSKLPGGKFVVCGGRIQGTAQGQTFRGRDFTDCVSWSAGETTWRTAFLMRLTLLLTHLIYAGGDICMWLGLRQIFPTKLYCWEAQMKIGNTQKCQARSSQVTN